MESELKPQMEQSYTSTSMLPKKVIKKRRRVSPKPILEEYIDLHGSYISYGAIGKMLGISQQAVSNIMAGGGASKTTWKKIRALTGKTLDDGIEIPPNSYALSQSEAEIIDALRTIGSQAINDNLIKKLRELIE